MTVALVALNGKVVTMDDRRPLVQAFAVSASGRVIATGDSASIAKLAGPDTAIVDLQGKTVTPGLIDTHIHVVSLGSTGAGTGSAFVGTDNAIDVGKARTTAELCAIIAQRVRHVRKGEWVVTSWPNLAPGERLDRNALDAVASDNPVMITGYPDVIVNSYLMRQAGITEATLSPPGGEIGKDPQTGKLNGVFTFQAIYKLLPQPPEPSVEATEKAIRSVQCNFLSEGLTTFKDVGLRNNAFAAYRNLHDHDELQCRVHMMHCWVWSAEEAQQVAARIKPGGDEWLKVGSVKMSLDGSIPSGTAWSYEKWNLDNPPMAGLGYAKLTPDELEAIIEILHSAGLQVCCHCGGDKAIDVYLTAIENVVGRSKRRNSRNTIIHCELPTKSAIARMARLGDNIAVETQSPWMLSNDWAAACGPERARRFMPLKSMLDAGVIVGNGCDFPTTDFPPRLGLSAACTRRPLNDIFDKKPYGAEESLNFAQALYTYTLGAAKCLFWENELGSLEPGKCADFVVWNEDLAEIPVGLIKDASVLMTAVNGKIVFDHSAR